VASARAAPASAAPPRCAACARLPRPPRPHTCRSAKRARRGAKACTAAAVASQYFWSRTGATQVNLSQNGRPKRRDGRRTAPPPPAAPQSRWSEPPSPPWRHWLRCKPGQGCFHAAAARRHLSVSQRPRSHPGEVVAAPSPQASQPPRCQQLDHHRHHHHHLLLLLPPASWPPAAPPPRLPRAAPAPPPPSPRPCDVSRAAAATDGGARGVTRPVSGDASRCQARPAAHTP
jgi:hypothetical protein